MAEIRHYQYYWAIFQVLIATPLGFSCAFDCDLNRTTVKSIIFDWTSGLLGRMMRLA